MRKVLHYKTNFLNNSETFIQRLISHHKRYEPAALCYRKREFTESITVYEPPGSGIKKIINTAAFHLNLSLPYFSKIIKKTAPDVLHAHFGFDGYKLLKISASKRIPLIVSFYGSDVSRLPGEFGWKKRYNKLAAGGAHFISASDFMKKQLTELGFAEEKISVVPFGLDLNKLTFEERKLNPSKIMMAGRLVEKKGFEFALRSVAILQKKGLKPTVSVYGDGPLMIPLKKLAAELEIHDRVSFYGFQPVEVVLEAHKNHGLFLAPSVTASDGDMEGLPNTILEAMAKGTPVIATKHAAIPEAIIHQKSGFLVEERDAEGLADCIEKIVKEKTDLFEIAKKARSVVENKFRIDRMVEDVEMVYDRILASK